METIRQLESKYQDFYVPTFVVNVDRRDVVRELFLTVSSVSVDLKEKAAGRFSFTVASSFDWEDREFSYREGDERLDLLDVFSFGATVDVYLGYGEPAKLIDGPPMLSGVITELTTSFASGGTPELTVAGYDDLYWLTVGKTTRNWEGKTDSFAVADVAARNELSSVVEETSPSKPRIDQNEETDMAFIEKLAERNGFTFLLKDGALHFGPRHDREAPILELEWGLGLVGFSPEAKLGRQIAEVRVLGRDTEQGEQIVGVATKADLTEGDTGGQNASELVTQAQAGASSRADNSILKIRTAVHTKAEAEARAKGILEERAQDFLTGSGESIGLPEIRPDVNIELKGLGSGFSKVYYVSETTHTIDSGGYKTTFNVQEPNIDGRPQRNT